MVLFTVARNDRRFCFFGFVQFYPGHAINFWLEMQIANRDPVLREEGKKMLHGPFSGR